MAKPDTYPKTTAATRATRALRASQSSLFAKLERLLQEIVNDARQLERMRKESRTKRRMVN
jgi:hypothetical protein